MISQLSQTILCGLFVAITMSANITTQSLVVYFYISNQKVMTRVKFQPISYYLFILNLIWQTRLDITLMTNLIWSINYPIRQRQGGVLI